MAPPALLSAQKHYYHKSYKDMETRLFRLYIYIVLQMNVVSTSNRKHSCLFSAKLARTHNRERTLHAWMGCLSRVHKETPTFIYELHTYTQLAGSSFTIIKKKTDVGTARRKMLTSSLLPVFQLSGWRMFFKVFLVLPVCFIEPDNVLCAHYMCSKVPRKCRREDLLLMLC